MKAWTLPYRPEQIDWEPPVDWRWSRFDNEQEWLEFRLDKIGTSELSAAIGQSLDYASPWSIWQRLVDRERPDRDAGPLADAGHRQEPVVAQLFADVGMREQEFSDCQLLYPGDYFVVQHPEFDWLFTTPDWLLCRDGEVVAPVELKCAWHGKAKSFGDDLPIAYRIQVSGQLACLGLPIGYYAVLLWGSDFRWYREERHERFIAAMLRKVAQLWDWAQAGVMPPADFSAATSRAIADHFGDPSGEEMELPAEMEQVATEYERWNSRLSAATRKLDAIKNQVKTVMGNATLARVPDSHRAFSWKANKRGVRSFRAIGFVEEKDDGKDGDS